MTRRRRSRVSWLRGALLTGSKVLGDYQAVRRDRIPQRIHNRAVGYLTGRIAGWFSR